MLFRVRVESKALEYYGLHKKSVLQVGVWDISPSSWPGQHVTGHACSLTFYCIHIFFTFSLLSRSGGAAASRSRSIER